MLGQTVSCKRFVYRGAEFELGKRFQILITGGSSGLVETITDAVSVHSIKKALYARRMTDGGLGSVTLLDHFANVSKAEHNFCIAFIFLR